MKCDIRNIGSTQVKVSALGVGGAPLGGNFADVSRGDAVGVVTTAFEAGLNYFDTAPFYGFGRSERAVGDAIRVRDYVLSTKVGRMLAPGAHPDPDDAGMTEPLPFHPVYDYTYDGVMRSFEDSQQRLGLDRIDILLAHDIGELTHGATENARHFGDLESGGYRAMDELRRAGNVGAIGLGVNEAAVCMDALEIGDWDTFLLAGRYTLLEQDPLNDLIPACVARGATLIIGGPFNSGILVGREMWNYAKAPTDVVERVRKIGDICADHDVALPVAALQFPLAHPVVSSIIPGARTGDEFQGIVDWATQSTPASLWSDLQSAGLIRADAPLPDGAPILRAS
ncbi:MAG: aldo/keto reductase [Paracoccaceae bacterium]